MNLRRRADRAKLTLGAVGLAATFRTGTAPAATPTAVGDRIDVHSGDADHVPGGSALPHPARVGNRRDGVSDTQVS